ncbi:MAG: hypothetical protein ACRDRH_03335 [Pseudonocardia sp.]
MTDETVVLDPLSDRSRPGVFTSMRSHAPLIVGVAIIGGILGYLLSSLLPTAYTATSSVYFSVDRPFHPSGEGDGDLARFTADQAEIVVTADVLQRAAGRLDPTLPLEEIRSSVTAVSATDTSRMTIIAERPNPEEAQALANAVVAAYRELATERVIEVLGAAQDTVVDDYLEGQMRVRAAAYRDGVAAAEVATLPTTPSAPRPKQNGLIVGVVGLMLAIGWAVLRDQRRNRTASVADLDLLIGAPLITRYEAPASLSASDVVVTRPSADQLRAVHDVLAAVDVAFEAERNSSVLFLSWQRALTTTSLVVSAAVAAARTGRAVVLIDGGLKEQGISALSDVDPGLGLDALADPTKPMASSLRTWNIDGETIGIVPLAGWRQSAAGAVARPQVLRSATARLQSAASLVLVDGPPLTERSVGLALGRGVDGVVIVIDELTTVDDAHEIGRRIALSGVGVIGYVLTGPCREGRMRWATWPPKRRGEGAVSLGAPPGSH